MVAYCDIDDFKKGLDQLNLKSPFFKFIINIVRNGINSTTYSERAKIILSEQEPTLQQLEYNTTLAICDTTVGLVIKKMCIETPTLIEEISCNNSSCNRINNRPIAFLTFQTSDGSLNQLQTFLEQRLQNEKSVCGYVSSNLSTCTGSKSTKSLISPIHILVEVLYWNNKK